jgi:dolichol-phosphate mannosyltransferase
MKVQKETQWMAVLSDARQEEALVNNGNGHRDSIVIIPTYNEVVNLDLLVPTILRQGPFDILVIDDNSPDGTGELADELARRFPGRVTVQHRPAKLGLGSAYLAGFNYALARGYQRVFTMDADFSHDPSRLLALQAALDHADVVLGSRYVPGGETLRWPLWRRLLSRGGSTYAGLILRLPMRDLTGGFKGFRRQVLEALLPELNTSYSNGYAFQIEMTYRCARHGFRIVEVPILFENRLVGKSKMSWHIIAEALWVVWALRLSRGASRPQKSLPQRESHPRAGRTKRHLPATIRRWRWRRRAAVRASRGRRLMTAIVALVLLFLVMLAVTLAPAWLLSLAQGRATHLAFFNQGHSASSASIRPAHPARRLQPVHQANLASLQLRVADLTPGGSLYFAGSGFLPGERLAVGIQNQAGRQEAQLAPLNADRNGRIITAQEAIPATLPPGAHILLVEGQNSHHTAQATFWLHWITPTVQLDTYSVRPEHSVNFAGSGFMPDEKVEARLVPAGQTSAQVLITASANARGNIAGHLTIPWMPAGDYSLIFVGQQSQAPISLGFNIQGFYPRVTLDTYAPALHTRLRFTGEGFAPGEEILVYLNQQAVGSHQSGPIVDTHADADGRLSATWEVEGLSGDNTLSFVGQRSGSVIMTNFTIMPSVVGSPSPTT